MKGARIMAAVALVWGLAAGDAMAATASGAASGAAPGMVQDDGLLTVQSEYSAGESLQRIQAAVQAKGLTVFTVLDHQEAARREQLDMPAATVIVFGNPRLGTSMMVQSPTLAIDLPSKALVWEDGRGQVFVTVNTAEYLGKRHRLPPEMVQALQGLEKLVLGAVTPSP